MMNRQTVTTQLQEAREALQKNEKEHEILKSLIFGLEGWLEMMGYQEKPTSAQQPKLLDVGRPRRRAAPIRNDGKPSFRSAVLQVLQDARGRPLHCQEILDRARKLGAETNAKDPVKIVDLVGVSLQNERQAPIERVSVLTWRWTGPLDGLAEAR
jgi:hypothetical protein